MIEVSEIFGPTLQGEGPSIGRPAKFLRLRRCNLQCSWCDTRYTWDKDDLGFKEFRTLSYYDIIVEIGIQDLVVITGGEPLIWRRQLNGLLELLPKWKRIEIETNGTIHPKDLANYPNVFFNVSPKLRNSGNQDLKIWDYSVLRAFSMYKAAIFKFVCSSKDDLREVEDFVRDFGVARDRIYIMPEGTDSFHAKTSIGYFFQVCADMGFNLSPRLQVLAFGNVRGV